MNTPKELVEIDKMIHVKAKNLVTVVFPERIVEFNELLNSEMFSEQTLNDIKSCSIPSGNIRGINNCKSQKKRKRSSDEHSYVFSTVVFLNNSKIKSINNLLKPLIERFITESNLLKIWLLHLVPKIEDGNNFGVSVQEEVIEVLRLLEGKAVLFYDDILKYYNSRAKFVSKIIKNPGIENYREALLVIDEKHFLLAKLWVRDLRNHYRCIQDLIIKNWEKLICPRSSNIENMF